MTDKTITIPIYDARLRVVIATAYEEFEQAVFDTGYTEPLNGAGMIALRHEETTLFHVIINKDDISPGNIAHEALHVTNKLMHHLGMGYDWMNDEAMCYLLGFITDCIHKIIDDEDRDQVEVSADHCSCTGGWDMVNIPYCTDKTSAGD